MFNDFSKYCIVFGFAISPININIMSLWLPGHTRLTNNIIQYRILKVVDSFIYIGSTLFRYGPFASEISPRIEKASKTSGLFRNYIQFDTCINFKTMLSVTESWNWTVLLCTSKNWRLHRIYNNALQNFYQTDLKRLLDTKRKFLTASVIDLQ